MPIRLTDVSSRLDVQHTEMDRLVDAAVFDFGGVLTTPVRDTLNAWLVRDAIDPASFSRTLKAWLGRSGPVDSPIRRLELGELTEEEFNVILAAELVSTAGGAVAHEDLLTSMFAELRPDPLMFELVEDLKDVGVRVALLSNSWGNTYPRDIFEEVFDVIVISGEVGMRKPSPDVFVHTLRLLGTPAERVVFIDDADVNADGASRLGMHTVVHVDAADTRARLTRLISALEMEN